MLCPYHAVSWLTGQSLQPSAEAVYNLVTGILFSGSALRLLQPVSGTTAATPQHLSHLQRHYQRYIEVHTVSQLMLEWARSGETFQRMPFQTVLLPGKTHSFGAVSNVCFHQNASPSPAPSTPQRAYFLMAYLHLPGVDASCIKT